MSTTQTKKVLLSKPADWEAWFSFVRTRATNTQIWDLINPNLIEKPVSLGRPTEPEFQVPDDDTQFDKVKYDAYKARKDIYKTKLARYERQEKAFGDIITFIQDTIAAQNVVFIQKEEPHPWNLLRALKLRLAPSDEARKLEIEQKYHKLCRGPGTQNIETWLDEWTSTYTEGMEHDIAETTGIRPIRDFLMAARSKEPTFSDAHLVMIRHKGTTYNLYGLIEDFRQHLRLQQLQRPSKGSTHSAFATGGSGTNTKNNASYRGQQTPPRPCICGDTHWLADCPYLVVDKRTRGWNASQSKQKKVDDALSNEETKAKVERTLQRRKDLENKSSSTSGSGSTSGGVPAVPTPASTGTSQTSSTTASTNANLGSFCAKSSFSSFSAASTYPLTKSWILDNGSDIHVCNRTMLSRFTRTRLAGPNDKLTAGTQSVPIECFGTINITIRTPTGPQQMTLLNVAYISNFMTNLVSEDILYTKGVYFDNYKMHLHRNGDTIGFVERYNGHYLLENNVNLVQPDEQSATFTASTKTATMEEWHQILGHASHSAIQHLEDSAEGVKVVDKGNTQVSKTNECETCALSKAHRIVSRTPEKSESLDRPFYRVTYDLMSFSTAMNRDQWVSHFACAATDFNLVFTHPKKSDATTIIQKGINIIETRYNQKVVFFRSDGERALGIEFDDFMSAKGITYEPSAPDTPAQNGHSERKGGILAMKARAMRIEAGLPTYLWNEIMRTAGYIANRTPMKKHDWKTPFEKAVGHPPNLHHLRKLGCKAYTLDKHIPRKEKLQERAHVGHLIGYDSTNIFRVWIPSQRKIIRTRDVMFDETSFYDPHEPDLAQLTTEPMIDILFDIPDLDPITQITEIESDEEETDTEMIAAGDSELDVIKPTEKTAYLPTPDPTEVSLPASSAESAASTDSELSELESHTPEPPVARPESAAPRANEISAALDTANVLPEGVSRTRTRKNVYATALERSAQGDLTSFHQAFSAFVAASTYYAPKTISVAPSPKNIEQMAPRLHRDSIPPEPLNYQQMLKHPLAEGFIRATHTEIQALQAKGTWTEVPYSEASKADKILIPTTWVFRYKFDDQGFLIKYKARLCARGDLQHTEQDTFAATLAARIFRALMAIVAAFDLETRQYDAVNAFANSPIDEPTYCKTPVGWTGSEAILLLLLRALYGLKQSPALWYRHFSQTISNLGLEPVAGVDCLFTNDFMLLFFFVDDIVVLFDRRYTKQVDEFQEKLFDAYEMRHLGELEWFLGIRITRDRETRRLWLCQDSYVDKLTSKFNISMEKKCPGAPLPIEELTKLTTQATPQEIYAYQQRIGSINFAAVITRPDVAHAASKLSEFLTNPSQHHLECANRVLLYLAHTRILSIEYNAQTTNLRRIFLASSDASFANDPDTRQSSQGYAFMLFNGVIDWKASKQKTVTTSSTEAELLAISTTGKETIWWTRFFDSIDFHPGHETYIQCDNMQTIRAFTSDTPRFTTKMRHVDIHRHWLRQEVQSKRISIEWTSTTAILADGLTKSLPPQRHKEFVRLIGLRAGLERATATSKS